MLLSCDECDFEQTVDADDVVAVRTQHRRSEHHNNSKVGFTLNTEESESESESSSS